MISVDSYTAFIKQYFNITSVDAAVILGSGLGNFTSVLESSQELPYASIPDFPVSSVSGHRGSLYLGIIGGKNILCFSGRFHFYEGFSIDQTILPIQIANQLQAKKMLISNAAGGIDERFRVGDLMIIQSTLKWMVKPKVIKKLPKLGPKANDFAKLRSIAESLSIPVQLGNYIYVTGPNYESAAEIKAFRTIGAHAVGMSTYAEVMEAERLQLPYAAISLISNMAAGMTSEKLDHSEIKEAADARMNDLNRLVSHYLTH